MDSAAYISSFVRVLKNPLVGERRVPVGDGRCRGLLGAVPAAGLYMAWCGRCGRGLLALWGPWRVPRAAQ